MNCSIIILGLFLLHSCTIIDLKQTEMYRSKPSVDYEILQEGDSISISFSEDVDKLSVQSISSIRRNGKKTDISYVWKNGNKLIITSTPKLYKGLEYRLEFKGIYHNITGVEREAELSIPFYLQSSEFSPLYITEFYPADGTILNSAMPVSISFSTAVDKSTLYDAVKINPSVDIKKYWSEDFENTLIIEAVEGWNNLTNYRLNLDETLLSTGGDPLFQGWSLSFYIEDGSSSPSVLYCGSCSRDKISGFPWISSSDLDNLINSQALRIRFSETMHKEKTESALSISPSIAGECYWVEDDLVFLPEELFKSSQSFRLELKIDAESINGISMTENYILNFQPAIPPIELISLECSSAGGFILNEFSDDEAYDLPIQAVSPFELNFHFTFSSPFTSEDEKQKVQDSLRLYELFSSGGSPKAALFSWINEYRMTAIYSGFTADTDSNYYYLMELSGGSQGITNSDGSYMEETTAQLFRMARQ
jgi:hypothetical protein